MKTSLLLAGVLALTGCGTATKAAPAKPPAATKAPAGPAVFLAFARSASFGNKDFSTATDDQLLGVGNTICQGMSAGTSFGEVVQGIVESDAKPSTAETDAFARVAVKNLCPQYAAQLP